MIIKMKDMSLLNEANMRDVEQCSITTEAHAAHQHDPELYYTCMMHGRGSRAEVSLQSDAVRNARARAGTQDTDAGVLLLSHPLCR